MTKKKAPTVKCERCGADLKHITGDYAHMCAQPPPPEPEPEPEPELEDFDDERD